MTAKEFLSGVQRLQAIIEQKQGRIREIRESASSVRAVRLDLEKVQGGGHTDRFLESVAKIIALDTEIRSDTVDLLYRQHKIIGKIHKLRNPYHMDLLYMRYINGRSFKKIAGEFCYTYQYTLFLHGEALKAFEEENADILS